MVGAIADWSLDELRAIRSPTLILIGDKDFISVQRAAQLLGLIPNPQLSVLPGATHVEMTRRPDQMLAMVGPFLDTSTSTISRSPRRPTAHLGPIPRNPALSAYPTRVAEESASSESSSADPPAPALVARQHGVTQIAPEPVHARPWSPPEPASARPTDPILSPRVRMRRNKLMDTWEERPA